MKRTRRALSLLAFAVVLAAPAVAPAEEPPAARRIADLQVRSGAQRTEIELDVRAAVTVEDRTKTRPGGVVVDEVRLFFPGERLRRSRLVTVADQIVEEARLFPEEGGVVMTVVVRRPVAYTMVRDGGTLRLRFEPASLFAERPAPDAAPREGAPPPAPPFEAPRDRSADLVSPKIEVPDLEPGEGLSVDAEELTYDREKNLVIAKGRVTIARAGSLLTADEVRIDRETKEAEAIGNVQLSDPQGTVRAERFHVNLEDETGTLTGGDVYLPATRLSVSGDRFEKSYGQTYHIENGRFTTCDCGVGPPTWSIAGDEVDITLDGYGLVSGATFEILDVPVFYLPKAAFPAKVSRQSGLLAPQLGYSQKRGFTFLQPLYVVLNKSADATISADVETEARIGGILEYRYAAGESSHGTLNGSFFDETLRNNPERDVVNTNVADPDIPDQRWSVTADVSQELPFGARGYADALAVSDDLFLREIPTFSFDPEYERELRTRRYTSSRVGAYRLWDQATLIGEAVYYQDFIQEDDLTLQRLPQVTLFASERFFDRRLKLRFQGEGVNFVRDEGFDGPRGDFMPSAEVPFRWQEYLRGSLRAAFRETAYAMDDRTLLQPVTEQGGLDPVIEGPQLDSSASRELFIGGADVGTELQRIFVVDGENVEKLKHTIEPAVEYLFVPDVDQDDLPSYDFTDRIAQRNLVTYGLTSRLLAKLRNAPAAGTEAVSPGRFNSFTGVAPAPFDDERTRSGFGGFGTEQDPFAETPAADQDPFAREGAEPAETGGLTPEEREQRRREDEQAVSRVVELGRLQVFQSYDLDTTLQEDRNDHFSDVDVLLRLSPLPWLAFFTENSIDARDSELTASNVGIVLRDPRPRRAGAFLQSGQPGALGLSYRFIEDDVLEEVDSALLVPLADSLSAFYQSRYDAVATEFLENRFGFRLLSQCKCWILDLSVTDRINPNETEVRAQVTLVGLGSIGRAR